MSEGGEARTGVKYGIAMRLDPPFYFVRIRPGGFVLHFWRLWVARDGR